MRIKPYNVTCLMVLLPKKKETTRKNLHQNKLRKQNVQYPRNAEHRKECNNEENYNATEIRERVVEENNVIYVVQPTWPYIYGREQGHYENKPRLDKELLVLTPLHSRRTLTKNPSLTVCLSFDSPFSLSFTICILLTHSTTLAYVHLN